MSQHGPRSCHHMPAALDASDRDGRRSLLGRDWGNPAVLALVYECAARDIVMVHLTPAEQPEIPTTSHGIMNRMQEIGFNAALIREMRAVAFVNKRIDEGRMDGGKVMLIHVIEAEDVIREFPGSSRLNNNWEFLCHLLEVGERGPINGSPPPSNTLATSRPSISNKIFLIFYIEAWVEPAASIWSFACERRGAFVPNPKSRRTAQDTRLAQMSETVARVGFAVFFEPLLMAPPPAWAGRT